MLLCAFSAAKAQLSVLASRPDWADLAPFQNTITRTDFVRLLDTVYAPDGAWKETIDVRADAAIIHSPGKSEVEFRLNFAKDAASAKPVPRYWTPAGRRSVTPGKPLQGYSIALDPGHLGGSWAKMEERWFQIGMAKPVMEGEITLAVARLLSQRLTAMGATVALVRNATEPVTSARPHGLRSVARAELKRGGITKIQDDYDGPNDPLKYNSVRWESELLFYRVSEIRKRAEIVNERIKPDLAICLHLNAEEWGNPAQPSLTDKNHLHLLVNGNCSSGELGFEDIRHNMLMKLLNRCAREEFPLANRVAASFASATGLPAYEYLNGKARRVTDNPYVWARNLLANRLYLCPVLYCEPYVMNSKAAFDRVQLGDYEGTKVVDVAPRKSIYREYADAVAEGVANYFKSKAEGCHEQRVDF